MRISRLGAVVVAALFIPTSAFAFAVHFENVRGNNYWVETDAVHVDNDGTIAGVDARINGGSWLSLPRTTWGSYAKGMYVATGSTVEFRARSTAGAVSISDGYRWSSTPTLISTNAFTATFTPTSGSLTFIGTRVTANKPITRVEARINSGTWFVLAQTGTDSWGQSRTVTSGSIVEFRATASTNEVVVSARYTWTTTPQTGFSATFSNVHGNTWWLETAISANQTVAGADVRLNGGLWRAMARQSSGTWAASFQVGRGAVVEFRARNSSGATVLSAGYLWPDATLLGAPGDRCSAGCSSGRLCCQVSALADVSESTKRFGCLTPVNGSCPAPDLRVDAAELNAWYVETKTFGTDSCAVAEACVDVSGVRKLLRFPTLTENTGTRDLVLGDPSVSPNLFGYAQCHGHYHFNGYATYRLVRADGSVVGTGRKQSFCLGDSLHMSGSTYSPQYHCNYQGITAGWADEYVAALDCQWIDVTNVPAGSYYLEVTVNPGRSLFESNFTNNTARVPVTLR